MKYMTKKWIAWMLVCAMVMSMAQVQGIEAKTVTKTIKENINLTVEAPVAGEALATTATVDTQTVEVETSEDVIVEKTVYTAINESPVVTVPTPKVTEYPISEGASVPKTETGVVEGENGLEYETTYTKEARVESESVNAEAVSTSMITWKIDGKEDADGKADYNTTYTAAFTLNAEDGYTYDNDVTVTVNGKVADATRFSDTVIVVSYTFEPTAKDELKNVTPVETTLPNGSKAEEIVDALPDTVAIETTGKTVNEADVVWDATSITDYNPKCESEQVVEVTGELELPTSVNVTDESKLSIKGQVTVASLPQLEGTVKINVCDNNSEKDESGAYVTNNVEISFDYEGEELAKDENSKVKVEYIYTLNDGNQKECGEGEKVPLVAETGKKDSITVKVFAKATGMRQSKISEQTFNFAVPKKIENMTLSIDAPVAERELDTKAKWYIDDESGNSMERAVTWSPAGEKATYYTDYTATVTLEKDLHYFTDDTKINLTNGELMGEPVLGADGETIELKIKFAKTAPIPVVSVDIPEIDEKEFKAGTPKNQWIPEELKNLTFTKKDGTKGTVSVVWDLDNISYDPDKGYDGNVIGTIDWSSVEGVDATGIADSVTIHIVVREPDIQPTPSADPDQPTPPPAETLPPAQPTAPVATNPPVVITPAPVVTATPAPTVAPEADKLTLDTTEMTLNAYTKLKTNAKKGIYVPKVKMTGTIKATYDTDKYVVKYASSNKKIASVSKAGKVTGLKMGTAEITVKMFKKDDGTTAVDAKVMTVIVKPTLYIKHLTGKKYVVSSGKKYKKKKAVQFKIVGATKGYYLFYRSGNGKYSIYTGKKWKKNVTSIPKGKKTWVPLTGKKYNFYLSTGKKGKPNAKTSSNVITWKI